MNGASRSARLAGAAKAKASGFFFNCAARKAGSFHLDQVPESQPLRDGANHSVGWEKENKASVLPVKLNAWKLSVRRTFEFEMEPSAWTKRFFDQWFSE
jgi:hypothetical protein